MDGRCVGGLRWDRSGRGRGSGGRCGALRRSASCCLGETAAALLEPVRPVRAWWVGGEGRVGVNVGLHAVAEAAQVVDGLAGTAQPIAFRLGEPVQARRKGDGLELLADEEPLGQVRGEARCGGGDETVFGMGTEAEVVGQRRIPSFCWSAARGRRTGRGTPGWSQGGGPPGEGWANVGAGHAVASVVPFGEGRPSPRRCWPTGAARRGRWRPGRRRGCRRAGSRQEGSAASRGLRVSFSGGSAAVTGRRELAGSVGWSCAVWTAQAVPGWRSGAGQRRCGAGVRGPRRTSRPS